MFCVHPVRLCSLAQPACHANLQMLFAKLACQPADTNSRDAQGERKVCKEGTFPWSKPRLPPTFPPLPRASSPAPFPCHQTGTPCTQRLLADCKQQTDNSTALGIISPESPSVLAVLYAPVGSEILVLLEVCRCLQF